MRKREEKKRPGNEKQNGTYPGFMFLTRIAVFVILKIPERILVSTCLNSTAAYALRGMTLMLSLVETNSKAHGGVPM